MECPKCNGTGQIRLVIDPSERRPEGDAGEHCIREGRAKSGAPLNLNVRPHRQHLSFASRENTYRLAGVQAS